MRLFLLANRTHRSPAATVVVEGVVVVEVVRTYVAQTEVQVVSALVDVLVERTRPVVAVTTRKETAGVAIARNRKKNGVTILFTCYFISIYSVLGCPSPSAVACVS